MTIDDRFKDYIIANPRVFTLFCKYAEMVRAKGYHRYSADAIVHRIRWHENFETTRTDEFKINDHYSSRLARLLIERDPTYEGFFELRELRGRKKSQGETNELATD
jgi:hypothetical protein